MQDAERQVRELADLGQLQVDQVRAMRDEELERVVGNACDVRASVLGDVEPRWGRTSRLAHSETHERVLSVEAFEVVAPTLGRDEIGRCEGGAISRK